MALGTFDAEGEFYCGAALLDDTIETLTLALRWKFDEEESAVILSQLKQIQSAIELGDASILEESTVSRHS